MTLPIDDVRDASTILCMRRYINTNAPSYLSSSVFFLLRLYRTCRLDDTVAEWSVILSENDVEVSCGRICVRRPFRFGNVPVCLPASSSSPPDRPTTLPDM